LCLCDHIIIMDNLMQIRSIGHVANEIDNVIIFFIGVILGLSIIRIVKVGI
jgi:hypothetical protein